MNRRVLLFIPALLACGACVQAQTGQTLTGMEIMQEARRRHHAYDSVYEEWSIILMDDSGNRSTYNLRKYARDPGGENQRFLLLLDSPADVYGVAFLALKSPGGESRLQLYLPAHGEMISRGHEARRDDTVLGTDFTLGELVGDFISDYRFIRREDKKIENIQYYLVDVYESGGDVSSTNPIRRHYVRQDSYYIVRTDYLDRYGRLEKQLTLHDLKQIDADTWGAGMMLMQDLREKHSTLIKVNRRILSGEYVPDKVFTLNWLMQNQPPLELEHAGDEVEAALPGEAGDVLPRATPGRLAGTLN